MKTAKNQKRGPGKATKRKAALSAQQTIPYLVMHPDGVCQLPGGLYTKTVEYGRDFMQAQVKYKSEVKTAVLGDRTITVKNLTPVFSPQEQDKQSREVERRLFDVFRKYAGQRG